MADFFMGGGDLSFEDILELPEEEVEALMADYNAFKEDRRRFQKEALLRLPPNPPLVLDCIHFLRVNNGITTEGIFRVNGDANAVDSIRAAFVNDVDLHDILLSAQQSLHLKNYDIATALKSYFRQLETPLVPNQCYEAMKQAVEENTDASAMVRGLEDQVRAMPEPNKSIFCFTMMFFQDIVDAQQVNKMGASNLATCLTMSIVRFSDTEGGHMAAMLEVGISTKIIATMLTKLDFTDFIRPDKYLELLKSTTYKRELLPNDIDEFMEHPEFERFKKRYAAMLGSAPPPVPRRTARKVNP